MFNLFPTCLFYRMANGSRISPRSIRIPVLLTVLAGLLWWGAGSVHAAGDTVYSKDQLEGLEFLNEIRAKVGVPPLRLDPSVTQAALNHAIYYNANSSNEERRLRPHDEDKNDPGFTGESIYARLIAAGWTPPRGGYYYGEVMHFKQNSIVDAIKGWLDTAYHRNGILSPDADLAGFALVDGTAVLDTANADHDAPVRGGLAVYPYDGMTNASIGFYGDEMPNPLSQFDVKFSGGIVSVITEKELTSYEASITDEAGAAVPFFEEMSGLDELFFYPKSILKGFHTYTVSLKYQLEGSSEMLQHVWSFTTGKGNSLQGISFEHEEAVLNVGGSQAVKVIGLYNDGSQSEVGEAVIIAEEGFEAAEGKLKGLKPGDWTAKASFGDYVASLPVKVLTPLKTRSNQAPPQDAPLKDVKGHWAAPAIEWALENGIATGYENGTFKPDNNVSEAEFWIMFLRMFGADTDAYAMDQQSHWADGVYSIAKDRNFPLAGLKKVGERDSPMKRSKAAEIIAAADGFNYYSDSAVWYVLAMGYSKGKTGLSLEGYEPEDLLTRAEALQFLKNLQPLLKELKGRPASLTPNSFLPPLPQQEVYVKPDTLLEGMLIAEYKADGTLIMEGKFSKYASGSLTLSVQTGGSEPKQIEDVTLQLDSTGQFKAQSGPYKPDSLNLYLRTKEVIYFLDVKRNNMNVGTFSR
jgi:hypothetical protein